MSDRVAKKLITAKTLTAKIDEILEELGQLIETAETEKEADAIHLMIEKTSEYMIPKQISDIWDYLVDWKKVKWK